MFSLCSIIQFELDCNVNGKWDLSRDYSDEKHLSPESVLGAAVLVAVGVN